MENPSPSTLEFKSYYVVWKPKNTIAGKEALIKFKSYYVVWKPSP